jgi:hypothetical protein
MSIFNTSNDLAAQLIWGRYYQSNEPCPRVEKLVFYRDQYFGNEDKIIITNDGTDWAAVASRIQALLCQGYGYTTLPCEICGATELEDVLHCDGNNCGEAIPHGHEHPSVDANGDKVTYCNACQTDHADAPLEEL